MIYRTLADIVAAIHVGYVGCVVLGLALILLGKAFGWKWVRNRWFRGIHLVMIAGVLLRAIVWNECPLTWWERDLRELAGQENFEGSPVGQFLHDLIHPDLPLWVFPLVYSLFGLLILAAVWYVPVQWRSKPDRSDGSGKDSTSAKATNS